MNHVVIALRWRALQGLVGRGLHDWQLAAGLRSDLWRHPGTTFGTCIYTA